MAKETGLGWTTGSIDDSGGNVRAIKNDIHSMEFSTPRAVQDVTGIDMSAIERLHLLADYSATFNGTFNDASGLSHDVFKDLANARTITLVISGQTLAVEALLTDYALNRADDGSLTWTVPAVLANGTVPTWA